MKKTLNLLLAIFTLISCGTDIDDNQSKQLDITFKFTHNWDGDLVTSNSFNIFQYTTENGEILSIERLRYVISDITFTTNLGEQIILDSHYFIDVTNNEGLSFTLNSTIPSGTYSNVSFTFGLDNEDNAENHLDLNSASFNVPDMLGGGYHYMQFDGKYLDSESNEQSFNYHAIRAVDNPGTNPTFPQDTFFSVNLGAINLLNDAEIEVKANLSQWFKEPNPWDLNLLNTVLMPNSAAQITMYENGQNVFSIGDIIQE